MKASVIIPNLNGAGWLRDFHRVDLGTDRAGF